MRPKARPVTAINRLVEKTRSTRPQDARGDAGIANLEISADTVSNSGRG